MMENSLFSRSHLLGRAAATLLLTSAGLAVGVKAAGNITGRKRRKAGLKIAHTFLEITNRHGDMDSLLREFVAQIQRLTRCSAVEIRVLDQEGLVTHISSAGFTPAFSQSSCAGAIVPDRCACGHVARGKADPELSFYTKNGSFHVNSAGSFALVAGEPDRALGCIASGYKSVAVLPIRAKERTLGLIHLADPRENMVPLATVQVLEEVGLLLGTAVERTSALEALRESEMTARVLLDAPTDSALLLELDGTIVALNEPQARLWGRRKEELIGENAFTLMSAFTPLRPELVSRLRGDWQAVLDSGQKLHLGEITSGDKTYESQLFPVTAASGTVVRIAVYTRDITALKQAEAQLREAHDQLASLLALLKELASTLELRPLLELVLERLASVVQYDAAAIFTVTGDRLEIAASRGYDERTENANLNLAMDSAWLIQHLVETGAPFYIGNLQTQAPSQNADIITALPPAMIGRNARSWVGAPLLVKNNLIGVLCLGHREANFYDRNALHIVERAANKAAIAIANARLFEQAQDSAAAEERTRLAHALHDSVTQTLFSASLIARALPESVTNNPEAAVQNVEKLRRLIQGASAQMRGLLLELHPAGLVEEELGILLDHLSQAVAAEMGIPIALRVEGQCVLPADQQIALYRIAQEALHNIAKHADASEVQIELMCRAGSARLVISDNGSGFTPGAVPASHMGISMMRERAEKVGALFEISSHVGQGTQIAVTLNTSQPGDTS